MPPSSSDLSRRALTAGAVFYYRDFEGHKATKDRYFIVVGFSSTHFFCFTTSTSERLIESQYLASQVTPIIPAGRGECFRKACVVDCRELVSFDDIRMSNYLRSRRVTVEGTLSPEWLKTVARIVKNSIVLNERDKSIVKSGLSDHWEQEEDSPSGA
jgi:hypothetical protein